MKYDQVHWCLIVQCTGTLSQQLNWFICKGVNGELLESPLCRPVSEDRQACVEEKISGIVLEYDFGQ